MGRKRALLLQGALYVEMDFEWILHAYSIFICFKCHCQDSHCLPLHISQGGLFFQLSNALTLIPDWKGLWAGHQGLWRKNLQLKR